MKPGNTIFLAGIVMCIGLSGTTLTSCSNRSAGEMVIFTRIPADNFKPFEEEIVHQSPGAQIISIHPEKPGRSETILTSGFYSACSPDLSYDAERMLFTAQQHEGDPWQIWEMDLKKGSSIKITDFRESCSGPAYLPGNRLVFSKKLQVAGTGSGSALFTMNLDGSNANRITFQPHDETPATILRDGRILMLTRQLYPEKGDPMYLAMRPNGTKAELFYPGAEGSIPGNRAYESRDGTVTFIRREKGKDSEADLVSVHQNRPLFSEINHTSGIAGSFYSAFPLSAGDLIVSYHAPEKQVAGLYYFSINEGSLGESIIEYPGHHAVDPILVEASEQPRNLPDEINPMESTGQLFCQDINCSANQPKATRIEVLGIHKSLGIVPVEADGSFYLKILADTPFRLQTLDDEGRILNGPSGWLWLRPFERRGCVGCHEDPDLVPENLVPLAVKKQPVSIPVEDIRDTGLSSSVRITE